MKLFCLSVCVGISATLVWPQMRSADARNYGVVGETFPIVEPDFLSVIQARLYQKEANGEIDQLNRKMVAMARDRVRNPAPVPGIVATTMPRSWLYDPSIIVGEDIKDHHGRIIAAKGVRANPLETIKFNRKLIFVQGTSPEQVQWALDNYSDHNSRIIFVDGSPFDAMKQHQHKLYFDQSGFLVRTFGIRQVPATIKAEGNKLRIREITAPKKRSVS